MEKTEKIIELYEKNNQLIKAAIDKIVVEIFNKKDTQQGGQAIVLTGCSPLVGTTSTSISLGIAVATSKRKTLVIDCDVRKAIKYKKLNEQASLGLADFLLDEKIHLEDVIYKTNIDSLNYIPCGDYAENSTRILCSEKMGQMLELLKQQFDCIIFDCPSITIVPDAQILFKSADGIILLAALGETRKKQIKEAKMKVKPFADKYYGMIVNKITLDVYKQNVKDYDYYLVNKKGEQKLKGNHAYKKYQREALSGGGKK